MGQQISGPGVLLPPPQNYYPSQLYNAPSDPSSNVMTLNAGSVFNIPAGNYYFDLSPNLVVQYQDPVNSLWDLPRTGYMGRMGMIKSDGYTCRIANLTGCPVVAVVTNAGSGYPTTGTTCTSSGTGGSTWEVVVGGQLSVSTVSVTGGGYGVPPIVMIPPPPSPGVQATAYATLTSGTVSGVTLNNVGAGYPTSGVTAVIVPSPFDPNVVAGNAITQATVVLGTIGAGSVSAVLCTNPGNSLGATAPTLTISGTGGSSATATAYNMLTLTGATVFAAGVGYTGGAYMTTIGGIPSATAVVTNPLSESRDFIPRPAQVLLAVPAGTSIASVSAIYDGGLFIGAPAGDVVSPLNGALITTSASVSGIYGSAVGTYRLQPAP
jgi:hypothetical protein